MESNQKLELIDQAIQKLLAENRNKAASADTLQDDNDHLLLSKLLSQLELSKSEDSCGSVGETGLKNEKAVAVDESGSKIVAEEIVKELGQVKRQNIVTHCLLSAMIVLTVAWQLSEVSLILKLKDGFSHPFRSFGGMLLGMFRVPGIHEQDELPHTKPHSASLQLPELPHVELGSHGQKN